MSNDADRQKCLASVEALAAADNQALLADVAIRAFDANTRAIAADKLTDEPLLATRSTRGKSSLQPGAMASSA